MYNRYVPQSDGSYCRHSVPDKVQKPKPCAPKPPERPDPPACPPPRRPEQKVQRKEPQTPSSGGLLQRLLPGGLDTEDLIIILLLLLIAGNCREDQSFALLTLGLYLFM